MSVTSHHKTISLDDLTVDPRVQRREGVDQRRVDKIAENFNPLALGTITLSQRPDGTLVLLDGWHRTSGARQAGYKQFVNAEVIVGLSLQQEAELFLLLNATKTPSALSKFLVRVVKGDEAAVEMNAIIESHGWRVKCMNGAGCVTAVTAVERVYRNGGGTVPDGAHPELLGRVLEIVTAAWEHDQQAVEGHILLGLAQLIGRFGPSLDTKKIVAEMQDTRPGVLVGRAKVLRDAQGGTVPAALAKILAGLHNKKRRSNLLPEWVWIR